MKINIKMVLSIILIVGWLGVIFVFSNMDTNSSNGGSKGVIYGVVSMFNVSDEEALLLVDKLNYPFRKFMHMFEYFVLSVLLIFVFNKFKYKYYLVLLICFLYSLTDEFHQLFIVGRTGQFKDCIIDTVGALIGLLVYRKIKLMKEDNG